MLRSPAGPSSPRPRPAGRARHACRAGGLAGQPVDAIRGAASSCSSTSTAIAIAVNPMLTGRFQLAARRQTADQDRRRPRLRCAASGPPDAAPWTRGAPWLPADDAGAEIRYSDPTQMGKVYLRPAGIDRPDPRAGRRASRARCRRPGAHARRLAGRIQRHPGSSRTCCATGLRGRIGNAYSDEILHAAAAPAVPQAGQPGARGGRCALRGDARDPGRRDRRSCASASRRPSRSRSATSSRSTTRAGAGPRCGTRITEVKAGGFITSYCRGCQR